MHDDGDVTPEMPQPPRIANGATLMHHTRFISFSISLLDIDSKL